LEGLVGIYQRRDIAKKLKIGPEAGRKKKGIEKEGGGITVSVVEKAEKDKEKGGSISGGAIGESTVGSPVSRQRSNSAARPPLLSRQVPPSPRLSL